MVSHGIHGLAVPGVVSLVSFLAYGSQWLFYHIEPSPLRKGDTWIFNILVGSLLVCYLRTCLTDPGRIPSDWYEKYKPAYAQGMNDTDKQSRQRYCRRCDLPKPPRSHHCKTCKRCVMRMDHHCIWTANCVSHITFPHFVRFLFYAVLAMAYLETFLYTRCAVLWHNRNLPSCLGPSVFQLALLFALAVTNSFVLFALTLLLGRTIWGLALNITTIEGWEIERHEALRRRARVMGGYLDGPDGTKVRIDSQEFPWDIGIWSNMCQAFGTRKVLAWFWPFARNPSVKSGIVFEHNEIDDPSKPWPPPDPDRMYRAPRMPLSGDGFTQSMDIDDFRRRQETDRQRYADGAQILRRRPFHERYEHLAKHMEDLKDDEQALESDSEDDNDARSRKHNGKLATGSNSGEEVWRNKEGERLADFGLDEDAEFYDEDDLPLAELLRRRRAKH